MTCRVWFDGQTPNRSYICRRMAKTESDWDCQIATLTRCTVVDPTKCDEQSESIHSHTNYYTRCICRESGNMVT